MKKEQLKELVDYARSFDLDESNEEEKMVKGIIDFYDTKGFLTQKQIDVLENGKTSHLLCECETESADRD